MKRILVLGAGNSSPSLITYLLNHSEENDWQVTVGDIDQEVAAKRINGHPRGTTIRFDVFDEAQLNQYVSEADLVVCFLAPKFQPVIAKVCVDHGVHMVSASYQNPKTAELDALAKEKGVIILNEMGLDPGMDIMSAMVILNRVRKNGGVIKQFISYGSGVPAPENPSNPMRYVITWNPMNVVIAGGAGAQYMENGKIKVVTHKQLFRRTWPFEVEGVGTMEAYPNRDSLIYREIFGLDHAETLIRGTLRFPRYCEVWDQIVKLGLTDEINAIPELENRSLAELVEMCLPIGGEERDLRQRVAEYLAINPTGFIMETLEWLGLFDNKKLGFKGKTMADAMKLVLETKMPLAKGDRDMVILAHDIIAEYPDKKEKIVSTFVHRGDPEGNTGMAQTVGTPAAIGVKMILTGEIALPGVHMPIIPEIYDPVLRELAENGMAFSEHIEAI